MIPDSTSNDENEKDTPYNFGVLFYIQLGDLLKIKNQAYMNNDLKGWYKGLHLVYRQICFKLKEDPERSEIKELFRKAKDKIISNNDDVEELHLIDEKLMLYMDKYKMIFPRVQTMGLKRISDRYKDIQGKVGGQGNG